MLPYLGLIPLAFYFAGFMKRRERMTHVRLMITAVILDLLMVVIVEAERHVVKKVIHGVTPLLKVHVTFAVSSLALCAIAVVTGARLYYGKGGRRIHKSNGVLLLGIRTAVAVTSFMVSFGIR